MLLTDQGLITHENDDEFSCKLCGDVGHRCLEELPESLTYDAYGARTADEPINNDIYNYCGGEPMGYPGDKWPLCPKHGPLLFVWQMTDQKHGEPCLIQAFICGTWDPSRSAWNPKYKLNVNLGCYRGEQLHNDDCRIHFDIGSNKNFGYLMRRFFLRPGFQYLPRPTDRHVTRTVMKSEHSAWIKDVPREPLAADDHNPEIITRERIIPKKFLRWEAIKMPYTVEEAESRAAAYPKDPGQYYYFGKDPTPGMENLDLLIDCGSLMDIIDKANDKIREYTLVHHTLGYCEQHTPPHNQGYIFMIQEAGYLNMVVHANPCGGIGITKDLTMHYVG